MTLEADALPYAFFFAIGAVPPLKLHPVTVAWAPQPQLKRVEQPVHSSMIAIAIKFMLRKVLPSVERSLTEPTAELIGSSPPLATTRLLRGWFLHHLKFYKTTKTSFTKLILYVVGFL